MALVQSNIANAKYDITYTYTNVPGRLFGPHNENLTLLHANNKGADQPAHWRRLISIFVFRYIWKELKSNLLHAKVQYYN